MKLKIFLQTTFSSALYANMTFFETVTVKWRLYYCVSTIFLHHFSLSELGSDSTRRSDASVTNGFLIKVTIFQASVLLKS